MVAKGDALIASPLGKFVPAAVFATSVVTTAELLQNETRSAHQDLAYKMESATVDVEFSVQERMRAYEQILTGARGLFESSDEVTSEEFRQYVKVLSLEKRYPEIVGVLMSRMPSSASAPVPIAYVEPFNDANAKLLGFDNFSNASRKEAMETARDSGSVVVSQNAYQIRDRAGESAAGSVIFLPVYERGRPHSTVAERRANTYGWVSVSFRTKDFMQETLGRHLNSIRVEIYDGSKADSKNLRYDSHPSRTSGKPPLFRLEKRFRAFDREWTLVTESLPVFEATLNQDRPNFVLALGTATTISLTFLFWLLIRGRADMLMALAALRKNSEDLRKGESRYRALFEDSRVPMLVIDPED